MKKLFLVLFGLLLAVPAEAAWNVRQKDNGGTVWVNPDGVEVPVGDTGLVVSISSFANQLTHYVVSQKAGLIKKVWAVSGPGAYEAQAAAPIIGLAVSNGATAYFTPISASAAANYATLLTVVTANEGFSSSLIPNDTNPRVPQGGVIGVKIGGSSSPVPGKVFILIE